VYIKWCQKRQNPEYVFSIVESSLTSLFRTIGEIYAQIPFFSYESTVPTKRWHDGRIPQSNRHVVNRYESFFRCSFLLPKQVNFQRYIKKSLFFFILFFFVYSSFLFVHCNSLECLEKQTKMEQKFPLPWKQLILICICRFAVTEMSKNEWMNNGCYWTPSL
jgi:hypothetical protein